MKLTLSKLFGFTLIELMVTLSIVAVVSFMAVPTFVSTVNSNQATNLTNEFVSTLNFARSEAIKREYRVVVGMIGETGWEEGWRVFVDFNGNNTFNSDGDNIPCEPAVGNAVREDCELKVSSGLPSPYTLRDNFVGNYLVYYSSGMNNVQGSFMLCNDKAGDHIPRADMSKLISINRTGRLRIAKDTDSDGISNVSDTGNSNVSSCISPFS